MAHLHRYHPERAIADPEAYYTDAFENYPHPSVASAVGRLAMGLAQPTCHYYGNRTRGEFFAAIPDDMPIVTTFTHRGRKRFHDISAAAATVFGTPELYGRLEHINVWAAAKYMTHPVFGKLLPMLGGVPAIRSGEGDYKVCTTMPSSADRRKVTETLVYHSQAHLHIPRSVLAIFPAGTKMGTSVQEGVGLVLEGLDYARVLPIAFTSLTEQTRNIPKDLHVTFCEPIDVMAGITSQQYVEAIARSFRGDPVQQ